MGPFTDGWLKEMFFSAFLALVTSEKSLPRCNLETKSSALFRFTLSTLAPSEVALSAHIQDGPTLGNASRWPLDLCLA